ncbi:MAG TPA: hypothetical protein VNW25_00070 [Candidatus Sulfotelmatobacter sp.]|jgi:hypothetical protein|nr:hypothetical protein [Candidatus Sulfotelmatobacter sp.]
MKGDKPLADVSKVEAYKAWCYLCEGYLLPVEQSYIAVFKMAQTHLSEVHAVKNTMGKVKEA